MVRMHMAYSAYSSIRDQIRVSLPPSEEPIDFQNISDPSLLVQQFLMQVLFK